MRAIDMFFVGAHKDDQVIVERASTRPPFWSEITLFYMTVTFFSLTVLQKNIVKGYVCELSTGP